MDARPFVKRNASTILTVLGSIGVVATTISIVKATSKTLRLIEEAETKKGEKLIKWETIKIASPSYISMAGLCLVTMTCVIGAEILNQKKTSIFTKYIRSIRSVLQRLLKNTKFA